MPPLPAVADRTPGCVLESGNGSREVPPSGGGALPPRAKRDYGIWRGGDLIARATFALAGFVLGIICVEVPYIPIQAKWFPALLLVLGPLFPDAVMWLHRRRWRKKLEALIEDLRHASETIDTYRPLSELTHALEMPTELAEAPPIAARERG